MAGLNVYIDRPGKLCLFVASYPTRRTFVDDRYLVSLVVEAKTHH